MTRVLIERVPFSGSDWQEFVRILKTLTKWPDNAEPYCYVETVDACELAKTRLDGLVQSERLIEGRVFLEPIDVRWVAQEDGSLSGWMTRELPAAHPGPEVEPANRVIRRYYLLGRGSTGKREFKEGRFPDKTFLYPVAARSADDRAFIRVAEYYRCKPSEFDNDQATVAAIDTALALPMLFAHRFVDVGAGVGEEPEDATAASEEH